MTRNIVKVKRRVFPNSESNIRDIGLISKIEESVDGVVYFKESISPFILINKRYEKTSNGQYKYQIQFLKTGYKKIIRGNDLNRQLKRASHVKDRYSRTFFGVGYLGEYEKVEGLSKEDKKSLLIKWQSAIKRCNGTGYIRGNYKSKNIFIHHEWHSFENFLKSVQSIPQFELAKRDSFIGWDLDKDYYGGNCYSPYTCVFLNRSDNTRYTKGIIIDITDIKTKKTESFIDFESAGEHIGVTEKALKTAIYKKHEGRLNRGVYLNYIFKIRENNGDILYRYELN